jgi:hypothetical protein
LKIHILNFLDKGFPMKRVCLLLCTLAASFALAGPARADQISFTITSKSPSGVPAGTVILDATTQGGGVYTMTGVEPGSFIDLGSGPLAVTGASNPGGFFLPAYFAPNYHVIFWEGSGVNFTLSDGESIYVYDEGLYDRRIEIDYALINGGNVLHGVNLTVAAVQPPPSGSPVPEPSSLVLVGTSMFGLAGMMRKRFLA